ncbi:MAG TPA: YeeE/YedE thiosulfate transporter family protein, partial [Anaerolineaceae bacterium]
MIQTVILPLIFGILFGFALNRGGLTQYRKIVGVFRFTDLTVIKFMLTALITAGTGLYALSAFGLVTLPTVPATYIAGNLGGGFVFGIGMSLAGYCPGTIAAGAGEGKLDYLIPGGLGLIAGALLFGLTYQQVFPPIRALADLGNVILPQVWHINPFLMMVA